jgi:hypothetical protein
MQHRLSEARGGRSTLASSSKCSGFKTRGRLYRPPFDGSVSSRFSRLPAAPSRHRLRPQKRAARLPSSMKVVGRTDTCHALLTMRPRSSRIEKDACCPAMKRRTRPQTMGAPQSAETGAATRLGRNVVRTQAQSSTTNVVATSLAASLSMPLRNSRPEPREPFSPTRPHFGARPASRSTSTETFSADWQTQSRHRLRSGECCNAKDEDVTSLIARYLNPLLCDLTPLHPAQN